LLQSYWVIVAEFQPSLYCVMEAVFQ
jgi:hypothetical protein